MKGPEHIHNIRFCHKNPQKVGYASFWYSIERESSPEVNETGVVEDRASAQSCRQAGYLGLRAIRFRVYRALKQYYKVYKGVEFLKIRGT